MRLKENIFPSSADDQVLPALVLDPAVTRHALEHEEIEVYSFAGDHLKNITSLYDLIHVRESLPFKIDAASPLYNYLLGGEWPQIQNGERVLPARGTFRIGMPDTPGQSMIVRGYGSEAGAANALA